MTYSSHALHTQIDRQHPANPVCTGVALIVVGEERYQAGDLAGARNAPRDPAGLEAAC
jgi:hypothetical protein